MVLVLYKVKQKVKNPKVSIIIVNWNGKDVLAKCLKSLSKIEYRNYEVILVDNNSTDGSQNYLKKYITRNKTFIIQNQSNLGFAPANNQGYKIATGKYVLLLNNDTEVSKTFLSGLVKRMEEDLKIGAIQPKIFLMDKKGYLDNAGSFMTQTGFLQHWGFMEKDRKEFSQEKEVLSTKGACMLIRKEVIDKVGLFDNDFFSYFEETDFCLRSWLIGYKSLYYPNEYIFHKLGSTSKKMNQIFVNYHAFKNRLLSYLKCFDTYSLVMIFIPHLILNICLGLFYFFKSENDKSKMIFLAISWNLINIKSTMKKRKKVQNCRKVSDSDIFKNLLHTVNLAQNIAHFKKVEANFKNVKS